MNGYWAAAVISLWLLLIVIAVAQLGLLRKVAPLLEAHQAGHGPGGFRVEGLPVGDRPADFIATTADGAPVGRKDMLGRPVVVLLSDAGCGPCEQLAAELRAADGSPLDVELVAISSTVGELGLPSWVTVWRQQAGSAAAAFGTYATPHAFALDAETVVLANKVPQRLDDLRQLASIASRKGSARATNQA